MNTPVTQRVGVDLDEARAVDEHLGSHVTRGNQLCPVLQPLVGLLQQLDQRGTLPRPQATHKLHQVPAVQVHHHSVDIHAHFICAVHKLQVQCFQKLFST